MATASSRTLKERGIKMKVFDFDGTLYRGESVVDFLFFMLKKNPLLLFFLPVLVPTVIKYKLGRLEIDDLRKRADKFAFGIRKYRPKAEKYIAEFWRKQKKRLDLRLISLLKPGDVIISAAPRPLIEPVVKGFGDVVLIASEFSLETGKFGFICMGENKLKAFREKFGATARISVFYSDSNYDLPLAEIADRFYLCPRP